MPKGRIQKVLIAAALLAGFIPIAVLGLFMFMSATAPVLHPDANAVPSTAAQIPTGALTDAVERSRQIVRAALMEQNVPGWSVAVGIAGEVVWAEGFGFAALESQSPMTADTLLRIGTASKVLTSAGVGRLLDQGKLNLDDPIQRRVPDFPEQAWPVTLRHLMSHTSGLRNDGGDEGPLFAKHCDRPVEAFPEFVDRDLLFAPGSQYRDSHFGWIVVSAAVEAAAQLPLVTFMRQEVFEPLGMRSTVPDSVTAPLPEQARFYFPKFAADPRYGPDPMREVDYSCYAGASVFLSTASDMVRFGMGVSRSAFLRPDTLDLLQAEQTLASGDKTGYALGWDVGTATLNVPPNIRDVRVVGHDGEQLAGQVSSLMTLPEHDLTVSVISNMSYAKAADVARLVAEAFLTAAKK